MSGIPLGRKTVRITLMILFSLIQLGGYGQSGGEQSYTFLNLPPSPRIAALGGKAPVTPYPIQPADAAYNPAQASWRVHNTVQASFSLFYASIKYNNAAYFYTVPQMGTFGVSLRQIWYGRFTARNELGEAQGEFAAYDMALSLHYAVSPYPQIRVGGTLTQIFSAIERYTSYALALDLGMTYTSDDGLISVGLLARNMGVALKRYSLNAREITPFELQAGVSITLENAPIRFIITLQDLQSWNTRYNPKVSYNPVEWDGNWPDKQETGGERFIHELLAHPILGVEIRPIKYFTIQAAYNHRQRMEMVQEGHQFLEGFSWGVGVHIGRFAFNYSRIRYHRHGASNHFSVLMHFGRMLRPSLSQLTRSPAC